MVRGLKHAISVNLPVEDPQASGLSDLCLQFQSLVVVFLFNPTHAFDL